MKIAIPYFVFPLLFGCLSATLQAGEKDSQEYEVQLYPLNGSGVHGEAEIEIERGNIIEISLQAEGLEIDKPHPQHIHGLSNPVQEATCPDISADVDADWLISVGEGLPFYGPIVLPLTPFDLVNANGELRYEAKFSINPASVQPIAKRTIVLHGMTVNGTYIPSLPVACGTVEIDD